MPTYLDTVSPEVHPVGEVPATRCCEGRSRHRFACPNCGDSRKVCRHCGAPDPMLGQWRSSKEKTMFGPLMLSGGRTVTECRCVPCTTCGERDERHVYLDARSRYVSFAKARRGQRCCASCGTVKREYPIVHRRVKA